jgi:phosphate:Na+ symporter
MQRSNLPEVLAEVLPNALRVSRYDSEMAELATLVAAAQDKLSDLDHPELEDAVNNFKGMVVKYLNDIDREGASPGQERMDTLQRTYQELKGRMLRVGTEGHVGVRDLVDHLDTLSNIRRLAEQADKAARYLTTLSDYLAMDPIPEQDERSEESGVVRDG